MKRPFSFHWREWGRDLHSCHPCPSLWKKAIKNERQRRVSDTVFSFSCNKRWCRQMKENPYHPMIEYMRKGFWSLSKTLWCQRWDRRQTRETSLLTLLFLFSFSSRHTRLEINDGRFEGTFSTLSLQTLLMIGCHESKASTSQVFFQDSGWCVLWTWIVCPSFSDGGRKRVQSKGVKKNDWRSPSIELLNLLKEREVDQGVKKEISCTPLFRFSLLSSLFSLLIKS